MAAHKRAEPERLKALAERRELMRTVSEDELRSAIDQALSKHPDFRRDALKTLQQGGREALAQTLHGQLIAHVLRDRQPANRKRSVTFSRFADQDDAESRASWQTR
jgi:Asp-tRNA(Asn)/Glu-tRNA(Gln) amidotransferase B subunit